MSDITPMAAVPSEVNYGRIRANFVAFIADDNGNVLEEVPLEGNVILTPTVGVLRFPSTSPPRTAVIQTLMPCYWRHSVPSWHAPWWAVSVTDGCGSRSVRPTSGVTYHCAVDGFFQSRKHVCSAEPCHF